MASKDTAPSGGLAPLHTPVQTWKGVTTLKPSNPIKPKPPNTKGAGEKSKGSGGKANNTGGTKSNKANKAPVGVPNNLPPPATVDKEKKLQEIKMQLGIVRSVLSGDSVTILDIDESRKENAPKEILFTILSLKAPVVGRRSEMDGKMVTKEEPWAWQSREFLRKMIIGKPVIYRVEHHQEERHYGELWDCEENDIRLAIVLNGWAEVLPKPRTNKSGMDIDPPTSHLQLENIRDEAKNNHRGKWKDNAKEAYRKVTYHDVYRDENSNLNNDDLYQLYKSVKDKGPLKAVVEGVRNGTTYNLVLTDTFDYFTLTLSGVRSPALKPEQLPYSREAKYIAEHFLLNRDVIVTIDGLDKLSLYGTVILNGNNFALTLLTLGLASFVEWTSKENSNLSEKFREAEKKAQEDRLRIWSDYQPPIGPKNSKQHQNLTKETSIMGKVIEIINAGTITVRVAKPDANNATKTVDRIIPFSSIRLPRGPVKNPFQDVQFEDEKQRKIAEEALKRENIYAAEAKEFLRNLLIGQRVRCVFDYPRASRSSDDKPPGPVKHYWSVYLTKGQTEKNVALELVQQGYAWVVDHAADELRSADYKDLILAEKAAKAAFKNLHSPPNKIPRNFVNDLTPPPPPVDKENKSQVSQHDKQLKALLDKSRHFLVGFTTKDKIEAVVDYVFAGSRYKITLPYHHCVIMFSLCGTMVDKPEKKDVHPKPDISVFDRQYPLVEDERPIFGNMALHLARDTIFQRKVEITVKKLDSKGVFIGQLWIDGKTDFGLQLIEKGYAKLHKTSIRKFNFFQTYKNTEENARNERVGLWQYHDFEGEKIKMAERSEKRGSPAQEKRKIYPIAVTDVRSGNEFSFQRLNDDETSALESLSASLQNEKFSPITPNLHDIVAAQFTVDDLWYRAQIISDTKGAKEKLYEVRYLDYGNREVLSVNRIRELPLEYGFGLLKAQAKDAKLYYLKSPALDSEFGLDSMTALRDVLWDKVLYAEQARKDETKDGLLKYHLVVHEEKNDLNKLLIRKGHCKVEKNLTDPQDPYYLTLEDLQEEARSQRRGIWQYGDDPEDDFSD